jgi:hypothetical protein
VLVLLFGVGGELFGVAAVGGGEGLVPRAEDERAWVGQGVLGRSFVKWKDIKRRYALR